MDINDVEAFPLQWPAGRQGTPGHKRRRSQFDTTPCQARDSLIAEVRRLGGRNLIISSNVPLRQDGLPKANHKSPEDPGVAVYFVRNGVTFCLSCDQFDRVECNMRGIAKTIDAMRGIERWGVGDMVSADFTGFAALPPPPGDAKRSWWEVLGVHRDAPLSEINQTYRWKAGRTMGDHDAMVELNLAVEEARKARA